MGPLFIWRYTLAWTPETNPFGSNRTPALFALSNAADGTFVPLAADPATGRLLVNSTSGAGGGTSSTFGATFPTTGTAAGAKDDTSGLMVPLTSHNVIGVTESLNVFVQNNTAGSILGRVNLYDTSDTNGQGVSSTNEAFVGGGIASGASDTGNPVKIGGKASNSAPSAVSDGQRVNSWYGDNGQQFVALARDDGTKLSTVNGAADAQSASNVGLVVGDYPFVFNGTTWDRQRSIGGLSGATGVAATGLVLNGTNAPMDDTTNFGDGLTTGIAAVGNRLYNGTGYDRLRSASTTANTTGVGLPGAGVLIWDGTNFQLQKDTTARGDSDNTGYLGAGIRLFNGSNYDRWRGGGVTGMAGVSLQASPSGGWSFINISTASTTTIKSGAGTFHLACVNSLGTVSSTATFYNNTAGSGTVIAIINTLALSGSFTYDIAFTTGLTLVLTGTVSPNVTVAWI